MTLPRWTAVLALALAAVPASALATVSSPVLTPEPRFTQGTQNTIRWNRVAFPTGSIGRGYVLRVRDVTAGSTTSTTLADEAASAVVVPNLVDAHTYRYTVQAFAQECTTISCTAFAARTFSAASAPQASVQDARPPVGTLAIDGGATFVNGLDVTMNISASDPQPGGEVVRPPAQPARHERPALDEAALAAARAAEKAVAGARERGLSRWQEFLEPLPELLRDASLQDLRGIALRARGAYGPKDSIRDALPASLTEPLLASLDRLLKALAREASNG